MLDVHPPHEAAHSWKDFFIHIATIVVGLLIAVGLEQTVEAIHHHHERKQLREDLVVEAQNNLELMKLDYKYFDSTQPVLEAMRKQAVDAMQHKTVGAQLADLTQFATGCKCYFPDAPVWNTAKQSAVVALLPRREAAFYDLAYSQDDLMASGYHAYEAKLRALSDFTIRFNGEAGGKLDLSGMSPEDLREYITLLASLEGGLSYFREMTEYAQRVTLLVADGNANDREAFQQIGVTSRH